MVPPAPQGHGPRNWICPVRAIAIDHSEAGWDISIFVQLILSTCRVGILHCLRPCVWFIVFHLLLWAKLIGCGCCAALVADANRDTFHILLNHMQLYQSPDSLTWHVASGSILLSPRSESWPTRTVGRRTQYRRLPRSCFRRKLDSFYPCHQ